MLNTKEKVTLMDLEYKVKDLIPSLNIDEIILCKNEHLKILGDIGTNPIQEAQANQIRNNISLINEYLNLYYKRIGNAKTKK